MSRLRNMSFVLGGVIAIMVSLGACSTLTAPYRATSPGCIEQLEFAVSMATGDSEYRDTFIEQFELTCHVNPADKYGLYLLGKYHLETAETERDLSKAVSLIKKAADGDSGNTPIYVPAFGNVPAQNYIMKTGPSKPGDFNAHYELGRLYLEGIGVKQSNKKARKYLTWAAARDHEDAAALLAQLGEIEQGAE